MTLTVDGGVFKALLPNMIPGKLYQVTVSAVKGLEESDPSTDTVTTGSLPSHSDAGVSSKCPDLTPFSLCSSLCPAALDRPRGLTAVNVTEISALLLWQPSVATVDGYIITYSADSGVCLLLFINYRCTE